MADKISKGWYRYQLLYGATLRGEHYEFEIVLHKRGSKGDLSDFSKEEAEQVLKGIGNFMSNSADYKTLKEDF
jgi:hypothetical protein